MTKKRVVLLLSGGLDSAVLYQYLIKDKGYEVYPITVKYGRRENDKEINAVKEIAEDNTIPKFVNIDGMDDIVNCKVVIPNRNAILLSIACSYAEHLEIEEVYIGANLNDRDLFPDCRRHFVEVLTTAFDLGGLTNVKIYAPFIDFTKQEIVLTGVHLKMDFTKTWSCYENKKHHCGKCLSCRERKLAFKVANVTDPTVYGG